VRICSRIAFCQPRHAVINPSFAAWFRARRDTVRARGGKCPPLLLARIAGFLTNRKERREMQRTKGTAQQAAIKKRRF
jgi:hypothetical protein